MTTRITTDYPLLAMIDAARGADARPLATDPQAVALERRATELAEEYWPDQFWLTGRISTALLSAVTRRLEAERDELHERIEVLVVTQQPATLPS